MLPPPTKPTRLSRIDTVSPRDRARRQGARRHGSASRGPKIAVPTRTIVAPSSMRHLEVAAHPHRQLASSAPSPQPRASSSSFRIAR